MVSYLQVLIRLMQFENTGFNIDTNSNPAAKARYAIVASNFNLSMNFEKFVQVIVDKCLYYFNYDDHLTFVERVAISTTNPVVLLQEENSYPYAKNPPNSDCFMADLLVDQCVQRNHRPQLLRMSLMNEFKMRSIQEINIIDDFVFSGEQKARLIQTLLLEFYNLGIQYKQIKMWFVGATQRGVENINNAFNIINRQYRLGCNLEINYDTLIQPMSFFIHDRTLQDVYNSTFLSTAAYNLGIQPAKQPVAFSCFKVPDYLSVPETLVRMIAPYNNGNYIYPIGLLEGQLRERE